ncbi:MAG TPA: DinB family protein [Streptosporangiaceae bacterium]|nr:DinB family protein [Streptosporangiaceae bacterium]
MTASDPKADLHHYLRQAREAVLWKLEGLSEYDVRRPLTPTGTNLLGLVKHLASVEHGYLGDVFGRPDEPLPWEDQVPQANDDMWATASESRELIIGQYQRVQAHSDATIEALPLDAIGSVPWWPEARREVTLGRILVHMTVETHRHAGHADIIRELIDGKVGHRLKADNMATGDQQWWQDYRQRVEEAARQASQGQSTA